VRFSTAANREKPDRVPVVYFGFGASQAILQHLGFTWQDVYWDGKKTAKSMLTAYDLWSHDNVCTFLSAECGLDALGVDLFKNNITGPPFNYKTEFIQVPKDLEKLKMPDPWKDGSMAERIKTTEILAKSISDKVPILGGFGGISTWAFMLRGMKNFVLDSVLNPKFQRDYMNFLTDIAVEYCTAQIEAGCNWIISGEDAFDSHLFSPEKCWNYNGVYAKRLAKAIHKAGAGYILHCCGDTSLTLEKMIDTGADILSVGKIDLADAKKRVRDKVALMGNIKLETLLHGSSKRVERACIEAINKASFGGGYLLSGSYIYPANTPFQNVKTVVESAKKYGIYKN
jgi:uroporphyrinogen decarboxylase